MTKQQRKLQERIGILLMIVWVLFLVLVGRFAWLQLVEGDELTKQAIADAAENRSRQSPRGKILDRNGRELAISRMAKSLVLNPSKVDEEEKEQLVADLAGILKLKPEDVREDEPVRDRRESVDRGGEDLDAHPRKPFDDVLQVRENRPRGEEPEDDADAALDHPVHHEHLHDLQSPEADRLQQPDLRRLLHGQNEKRVHDTEDRHQRNQRQRGVFG